MPTRAPLPLPDMPPDPTENVKLIVGAAVARLDDVIDATVKRLDAQVAALIKSLDERAEYQEKLAHKESARVDAIRDTDAKALDLAAKEARAQAAMLATQLTEAAETLRQLVATTASATAEQLLQTIGPMQDRLTELERNFNLGEGRAKFIDPILKDIQVKLDGLLAARTLTEGKGAGMAMFWGFIVGGIGIVVAVLTVVITLMRGAGVK